MPAFHNTRTCCQHCAQPRTGLCASLKVCMCYVLLRKELGRNDEGMQVRKTNWFIFYLLTCVSRSCFCLLMMLHQYVNDPQRRFLINPDVKQHYGPSVYHTAWSSMTQVSECGLHFFKYVRPVLWFLLIL